MAMTSLGVGSGLELDQMVRQLVEIERQPKTERLEMREEKADTNISALGSLKSAMSSLNDVLRSLRPRDLNARTAMVSGQPEDNPFFTATASSSAASSNYNILVEQLASGSRVQSALYDSSSDSVATGSGAMTISAGGDNSFEIDIEDGASLRDIADAINQGEDNFGVSASIINTGSGSYIVIDSTVSGEGNDLSVTTGVGGLEGMTDGSLTVQREAQDAVMTIDGIEVTSSTNTFENAIQGVSIDVHRVTTDTDFEPRLTVDIDKENVRETIDEFILAYNELMDEVEKLTEFVPEGDSGPLIGDSMVRSIQSQLSSIVSNTVPDAPDDMNMLFQLGITTNDKGRLEFDSRNIGGGTGEQRFEQALDQNFDAVVSLFSGDDGLATRLSDTVDQYVQSGGLIDGRTSVYENQKKMIDTEREQFERYMENYENNMRQRFTALDINIAQMTSNASYLFQFI